MTMDKSRAVLVVDDEEDIRELLELTLTKMGLQVDVVSSVSKAKQHINSKAYGLCLTDMNLGDGLGMDIIAFVTNAGIDLPIAVITAHGTTDNAVEALKAGAFDYIAKPVSLEQLRSLVSSALKVRNSGKVVFANKSQLAGESAVMAKVREKMRRLAVSMVPVHITGESGSGKERAARAIHDMSSRAGGAFVAVNCGAIPENLMEAEFFGVKRGAFTGADRDREGFFQSANGGSLFLDEVADLPFNLQVKLLRAIQERRIRRVGDIVDVPVDVRILSATHKNLKGLVVCGEFRQDLFFRINVIELAMPALREHPEDIDDLVHIICQRIADTSGNDLVPLTEAAMNALRKYSFPGNVRELENILERATALVETHNIDEEALGLTPTMFDANPVAGEESGSLPLQDLLDKTESQAIRHALQETKGNRTAAAKLLRVTFRSLRYRMERLNIDD